MTTEMMSMEQLEGIAGGKFEFIPRDTFKPIDDHTERSAPLSDSNPYVRRTPPGVVIFPDGPRRIPHPLA